MSRPGSEYFSLLAVGLVALAQLACGSAGGSAESNAGSGDGGGSGDASSSTTAGMGGSGGAASGTTGFESADPTNLTAHPPGVSASSVSSSSTSTNGGVGGSGGAGGAGGDDAAHLLEEADVVKVVDERMYVMSRDAGVAVLDASDVDELSLMGLYRAHAIPFEMYVKDGIVFALYQDYGEYVRDRADGTESFVQSSYVVVLDATEPANLTELQRFAIPGNIGDSRMVGDVLYVAAFEDGYCWGCADQPRTTLISLDVSDPAQVSKVDELSFDDTIDLLGWRHTLMVTDERVYLAGPTWGNQGITSSTLQVVDISDPTGALVEGATLQVAGQVNSRWQMDEYDGVLRVISQPFDADLSVPPRVETFSVASSDELTPLGSVAMSLPRPERLASVRFDGERAYAITVEKGDPLFTIDLSDPAEPVQAGTLEMPGWVYHMEPRGDRLVGVGYDQDNPEGAAAVSLFDVTDLKAPTLLSRANFGGDGAWLNEDQDRVHKALQLFDEVGLITMPFSGSISQTESGECYRQWFDGVQLIDWQNDVLTTRGVALMAGEARRGLLLDDRLVAVGDAQVAAFDISDRAAPAKTSDVALSQFVFRTIPSGNRVLRTGPSQSWVQNTVDIADLNELSIPHSTPSLSVGYDPSEVCDASAYMVAALATDERAYIVFDGDRNSLPSGPLPFQVTALDISGDGAPALLETIELEPEVSYAFYASDYNTVAAQNIVRVGDALVFNHQVLGNDGTGLSESGVHVLDLTDPTDAETRYVELPTARAAGGLFADGTIVGRSRYVTSENDASQVRYFFDRLDLSELDEPRLLPPLNTPGTLLALSGNRALFLDFKRVVAPNVSSDVCYGNLRVVSFEPEDATQSQGTCTSLVEVLTLIRFDDTSVEVLGTEVLPPAEEVGYVAQGDGVAFAIISSPPYYGYPEIACLTCDYAQRARTLLSIGGLAGGEFEVGRIDADWDDTGLLVANGQRAVVAGGFQSPVTLVDASDPTHPEIVKEAMPFGLVSDLAIVGSTAVVGLGPGGVETISFED